MSARTDLSDPDLPAVATLMGDEAAVLLAAILDEARGRVRNFSISQVRYVPARSITVQYKVDVLWDSGKPTEEVMVATSGLRVPVDTPVFGADGVEIAAWRFPNDPFLPGLAAVSEPSAAADLFRQLDAPADAAHVRTRAYRAGRRAVLEVTTRHAQVFVKVVRPDRAAALQRTHTELASHVPVPHSLGWSEDKGILALQALGGRTLRKSLESRSSRIPDPSSLVSLLGRFPATGSSSRQVAGPRNRVGEQGQLLSAVLPALSPRVNQLVGRLSQSDSMGRDPVHGDFHSSQILTNGCEIVGLVDVDTYGAGERIDDLASLLGHLTTLSLTSRARRDIDRYGTELIAAFDGEADPVELRLRTAAVVFGLATGPFRVQLRRWEGETEDRLALAERWVRSAEDLEGAHSS